MNEDSNAHVTNEYQHVLDRFGIQVLLKVVCTPRTRIESSQGVDELAHVRLIFRRGPIWIPRRLKAHVERYGDNDLHITLYTYHGVQQSPRRSPQKRFGGWTLGYWLTGRRSGSLLEHARHVIAGRSLTVIKEVIGRLGHFTFQVVGFGHVLDQKSRFWRVEGGPVAI